MQEGYKMNKLIGVVAAGGQSSRMGQDKSKMRFHDMENELRAKQLLTHVCEDVYLSKNSSQVSSTPSSDIILDDDTFLHHGPATALLSAHMQFPETSILLLGCDYPYLQEKHLQELVYARNEASEIVSYYHPLTGFAEPLICIYEAKAMKNLYDELLEQSFSLQKFIQSKATLYMVPNQLRILTSVDTPEQYITFQKTKHEY